MSKKIAEKGRTPSESVFFVCCLLIHSVTSLFAIYVPLYDYFTYMRYISNYFILLYEVTYNVISFIIFLVN